MVDEEKFYSDMSSLNNELVNLQRELVKKNIELEKKNVELKTSEEDLRESQRLFAEVANDSPALFWMSGVQKLRTWFNEPWLKFTGRTMKEEAGNGWIEVIHPADLQNYLRIYNHAFEAKKLFHIEFRLRFHNGKYKWFYDQGNPRFDSKGDFVGYIGFCIDITERKRIEARMVEFEALKKLHETKNDLLANISHELRTPLTSIKGYIETLMDPTIKWTKKQQIEFLNSANQEADHLNLLIKNLLDMSNIESGDFKLNKRDCTIDEVLEFASARLEFLTENHKLLIKMSSGIPSVNMDKVRIAQVITNLVENAVKFSPKCSPITIDVSIENAMLKINVIDEGIGLNSREAEGLFDGFFQVVQTASGKPSGVGSGLSICKGIIKAHGGRIWVESKVGKGSKFSFSLPLKSV
jgi:PAS domain S-box-containing protein